MAFMPCASCADSTVLCGSCSHNKAIIEAATVSPSGLLKKFIALQKRLKSKKEWQVGYGTNWGHYLLDDVPVDLMFDLTKAPYYKRLREEFGDIETVSNLVEAINYQGAGMGVMLDIEVTEGGFLKIKGKDDRR